MSNNTPKETPVAKSNRLLNLVKSKIEKIVTDAAKDPDYFGRPTIELCIQGGTLETINVSEHRSHK